MFVKQSLRHRECANALSWCVIYNTLMPKKIVEVNNLIKIFPDKKPFLFWGRKKNAVKAVNNISFHIKKGEIVGLLGPNGAGKTTTIDMLLGLITPTSGEISVFGKKFALKRKEILKKINFSSSYTHLPWSLTVWENLYVVAKLYGVGQQKEKISRIMNMLNLSPKKNTEVGDLSSGWITRLNLARTFINDPEFILLDEPTSSLDPEAANDIRKYILKLRQEEGTTILWTSHNMAEVEEVCDRVIFLHHGKIIAEDTPEGLSGRIRKVRGSLMITSYLDKLKELARQKNWPLRISGRFQILEVLESEIPLLLNSLTALNINYSAISIDKPTLEDFFLSIAGQKENSYGKN